MANRFPLILNKDSNQIQEIPSGDTLDLAGSGLNLTGITTLSSSAELNLGGGTNINTGTRGDILVYNASGNITKLTLGVSGKVLKSNGSDLTFGDVGGTTNVYYVAKSGSDASGYGGSMDTPFLTLKYAVANIGTPTATAPAIIFVKSGVYEEGQLPIVVPAHTTVAGDSLRATIIKPASGLDSGGSIQNNRSTLFKMSNATVLQDLVMDGMGGYTPGSPSHKPENATIGGIYLALNNASPVSTKSPYIYNCTSFGNGATGAVLDGSVHASGNRSMLFHTYTAVHSDGLGIFLKNNANAEMISTFTYYCHVGFAAIGGSKIRSLNSSNAYGEYAVYSAGFDIGETVNTGTVKGTMLVYTNVLSTTFQDGETITGGTSGATAKVVNVQAEPKRIYIVNKSGTFQASETVTGGTSGATATLTSGTVEVNQSGRVLVSIFASIPAAGDSLEFASTDGNAFQIQSVSTVTISGQAYRVIIFSTARATAVPADVGLTVRKEFSLVRLTGHDFLQVGTGGTDTTNWPNNPTQNPNQSYQVMTNETDPGRVYYTATDDLGNFYVGDQFKVDQATGNVTLDASAFNLSGLESLRLGAVGGLIGASVNEFSTDGTLSQNSNTKVPTQNAVKTYVDGRFASLSSDKIIEGDTSVETIDSGSDGNIQFKIDAALKLQVNNDGHTIPGADSASDLGLTGTRWRNLYADTLYGNGANITALNASNIASGTVPTARLGSGTANNTTFLRGDSTFATVIVAINSIANDGANRILTSDGDGTATAEANCTFDGGRFITKQGDSDIGMLVQNTSHDSQLRIETVAANKNSVIMFADGDDGDVGMIDYDHNDNSLGFTVNASERLSIDNNGTATFTSTADGVINVNTSASNGAFMRFRKQSSTTNVFHCGAAKGMIGSYPSVNDGAIMTQSGMMYLHSNSGTFSFVDGVAARSGIDIVVRGGGSSGNDANTDTSPFIRFRDFPTSSYANATTVDDNNWAIGADDSGVSEFKIVYGGGSGSNRVTSLTESSQTGTTVMGFQSDLQVRTTGFKVTETADLSGTSSVGGSTRNAHYDATPGRGTYMVHGHLTYRDGAPGGDPDQIRMVLQVDGSDIAHASVLDEDSNNIERNRDDAFSALITVNGSQNVQVETYTTDTPDPGGGDYRYRINIYKLGG